MSQAEVVKLSRRVYCYAGGQVQAGPEGSYSLVSGHPVLCGQLCSQHGGPQLDQVPGESLLRTGGSLLA